MTNDNVAFDELKSLRHELLKKRRSLSQDECDEAEVSVLKELLAHPALNKGHMLKIALYSAVNGEIPTLRIFKALRELKHLVAYPLVLNEGEGIMLFYQVLSPNDLKKGAYGILEPEPSPLSLIKAEAFDLMLIPLVGFDKNGNRLGMGGGFYDRFLKNLNHDCLKVGIAHDFQELTEIKSRAWDVSLDEIITPTRHLVFKSRG